MVDLARLVGGFDGMKNEYVNADDKKNTDLYRYIEKYGSDMSCVKISNRNNLRNEIAQYSEKLRFQGTTSGFIFTLDGTDYALLDPIYDSVTEHVVLHIVGDNIRHVCDVMVENGVSF